MGKPTMQEEERRGMAAIQALHASAISSSRTMRQIRGHGSDDTRLRTILANIDVNDPNVVDAWAMLVRAIIIGRPHRVPISERRSRRVGAGEDRSLRQQYIEHENDDSAPRRYATSGTSSRALWRERFGARSIALGDSFPRSSSRSRSNALATDTTEWGLLDAMSNYQVLPLVPPRGESDFLDWLRDPDEPEDTNTGSNNRASSAPPVDHDGFTIAEALAEPPAALDRASPVQEAAGNSRSSSPDAASRAWLAEYEAAVPRTSSSTTLGRRRRNDDSGLPSRRRFRHTEGGRDTRRDAMVFAHSPGPGEGWYDSMVTREREWRSARGMNLGVGGDDAPTAEVDATEGTDTPHADAPHAEHEAADDDSFHGRSRTMSLSAVGRGDRPVTSLPRRRMSLLSAE